MGSIFQGGGEGGLRMLQSEGGCLLWGQFFRGGGGGGGLGPWMTLRCLA